MSLIFNKNDMWKFTTLSVSPFDWLEASYFYYRPSDLIWEGNFKKGHYLDKGFNLKFVYRTNNYLLPDFAVGLDDFAGTGFLTREYIVATKNYTNTKITLGLGWGKYAGNNSFENPFAFIKDSLKNRPRLSDNYNRGGSLSYDQWFRGDSSVFGGFEFQFPEFQRLKLKLEYDPFNYMEFSALNRDDADFNLRKKDSDFNAGLSYSFNENLVIDLSYVKGNTLNLSFNFGITFSKDNQKKPKFEPIIKTEDNPVNKKEIFYLNLLDNLNNNKLFLQTADLQDNRLGISIATSDHRSAIRSSSYAAFIANEVANKDGININSINVSHLNAGVSLNNVNYIAEYFDDNNTPFELVIRNTKLDSGDIDEIKDHEFKPTIKFPVIFNSINPAIISHIGNPEKFYFGGLNLQNVSEIQFNRNILLSSEINYRLYDNFQSTISGPGSKMQHVRTDLVEYLKEDDIYITRMQIDYIWSPKKEIYAKLSAGIFETMYGGYGMEILYKPFKSNASISGEIFKVKQRSFNQNFDFKDYETITGHINFGYLFNAGIEANLSFGRYLAKDHGYTFDIGRRTKSGFKSGIYFTRTNVSAELFGEGSFDKGFYFQIPLDFFATGYSGNYSSIKISPLTRDGGAKLVHDKDLRGLIYNSSYYELFNQWDDYLD